MFRASPRRPTTLGARSCELEAGVFEGVAPAAVDGAGEDRAGQTMDDAALVATEVGMQVRTLVRFADFVARDAADRTRYPGEIGLHQLDEVPVERRRIEISRADSIHDL